MGRYGNNVAIRLDMDKQSWIRSRRICPFHYLGFFDKCFQFRNRELILCLSSLLGKLLLSFICLILFIRNLIVIAVENFTLVSNLCFLGGFLVLRYAKPIHYGLEHRKARVIFINFNTFSRHSSRIWWSSALILRSFWLNFRLNFRL